jgi:dTDP-4-amino-4,6-dideoxygalactose transaminase
LDIGSSYLPGEIVAAFLWAQMQDADSINYQRIIIWNRYHIAFEKFEKEGFFQRPLVPDNRGHNAHMYYLILPDLTTRSDFIDAMDQFGINCVFHYSPLHSSLAGKMYSRSNGVSLKITDSHSRRLVRLPFFLGLSGAQQDRVIETILNWFASRFNVI